MKKIVTLLLCGMALLAEGSILDLNSSTLNQTGLTTSSSDYSTALSVQANTGGDVLVIGTFSTSADAKIGVGSWNLSNGAQESTQITRTLDNKKDTGIASVVHIFSDVTAGSSINLQHSSSAGSTINTFGGNLVAIPLSVSTGEKLEYGLYQQSNTVFQTQSTDFTSSGVQATVQLDRASNNGIYMAASFNSQAITTSESGVWQLQYRKVGDAQWINTGSPITRSMSNTADMGSITLYGLADCLDAGTYEVQLAVKTMGGTTVETLNGTLAAVALSYTNSAGGGYFNSFSASTNALCPINGPYDALQTTLSLEAANSDIFASMNFTATAEQGVNQTAAFSLCLTNETTVLENEADYRFFANISDLGSGASVGLFSGLDEGEYTLLGCYDNVSGPITSTEANLVGFSTTAVPEPAIITLIGLVTVGALFIRRLFF